MTHDPDPEAIPSIKDVEWGPFEDVKPCTFKYEGIDEFCSDEATHRMVFEGEDGDDIFWYRCDDHTFPFVKEARIAHEVGYPVHCETCRMLGRPASLKNQSEGVADVPVTDGGTSEFFICQECADDLTVDLTPLDEVDGVEPVEL